METIQPIQITIYQSIIYRNELCWPHLDSEQVFKKRSKCLSNSPGYLFLQFIQHILVAPRSTSPGIIIVFQSRLYGRFIETESSPEKKLHKKNHGSEILGDRFSDRDIPIASTQFSSERLSQHYP